MLSSRFQTSQINFWTGFANDFGGIGFRHRIVPVKAVWVRRLIVVRVGRLAVGKLRAYEPLARGVFTICEFLNRCRQRRKKYLDASAAPHFAFDRDRPTRLAYHTLYCCQTKARAVAWSLRCEERFEQTPPRHSIHALAVILHHKRRGAAGASRLQV